MQFNVRDSRYRIESFKYQEIKCGIIIVFVLAQEKAPKEQREMTRCEIRNVVGGAINLLI